MLDHVTIGVSDVEQSKKFYDQALRPLGITRLYAEGELFAGYGISPKAFFWIGWRDIPQTGAHVAFATQDRATVTDFTVRRSRPAAGTTDRPEYARITIPTTMEPLFSTPTAIISRQFATCHRHRPSKMRQL
jgi:catechol 2,3-dioxygenase-like lactoylglutathione lyase family enzyme